jgi:copper chaperone
VSTITYTLRVDGMHCGSCALLIDDALEDLPGVRNTRTSVKQRCSVVEVDPTACSVEAVIAAIRELGYTVQYA